MIATIQKNEEETEKVEDRKAIPLTEAKAFTAKVEARSKDMRGGINYIKVWYGIIKQ